MCVHKNKFNLNERWNDPLYNPVSIFVTARDKRGHFAAKFKIELYIPAFSPGYVAHSGEGLTHVRPMVA